MNNQKCLYPNWFEQLPQWQRHCQEVTCSCNFWVISGMLRTVPVLPRGQKPGLKPVVSLRVWGGGAKFASQDSQVRTSWCLGPCPSLQSTFEITHLKVQTNDDEYICKHSSIPFALSSVCMKRLRCILKIYVINKLALRDHEIEPSILQHLS